jgi:O-antigen/teichoic acid export membrane protein
MNEIILMAHVLFGVACVISSVWVFVETLNVSDTNQARIRKMSCAAATSMWLAFLVAGYWYVCFYHNFFMESKEHLVILLLMLTTYLPIAAAGNLAANQAARRVVLWVAGLVVMLALMMEGDGAIIAMGVKMGLLAR